jgi:hypothetical protein
MIDPLLQPNGEPAGGSCRSQPNKGPAVAPPGLPLDELPQQALLLLMRRLESDDVKALRLTSSRLCAAAVAAQRLSSLRAGALLSGQRPASLSRLPAIRHLEVRSDDTATPSAAARLLMPAACRAGQGAAARLPQSSPPRLRDTPLSAQVTARDAECGSSLVAALQRVRQLGRVWRRGLSPRPRCQPTVRAWRPPSPVPWPLCLAPCASAAARRQRYLGAPQRPPRPALGPGGAGRRLPGAGGAGAVRAAQLPPGRPRTSRRRVPRPGALSGGEVGRSHHARDACSREQGAVRRMRSGWLSRICPR